MKKGVSLFELIVENVVWAFFVLKKGCRSGLFLVIGDWDATSVIVGLGVEFWAPDGGKRGGFT